MAFPAVSSWAILLACLASSALPAQGAQQLLQSAPLELGRAELREDLEGDPGTPRSATKVHVQGFFFDIYVAEETATALLTQTSRMSPDDPDQLLMYFFVVIVALFLCALLGLAIGIEDARPKSLDLPGAFYQAAAHRPSATPVVRESPVPTLRIRAAESRSGQAPNEPSLVRRVTPPRLLSGPTTGTTTPRPLPPAHVPAAVASPTASPGVSGAAASSSGEGPILPPSAGTRGAGRRTAHLCQGLVVPAGSECVLAVRLPGLGSWSEANAEVMDLTGKAVLVAQLRRADSQVRGRSRHPVVELKPTTSTPNAALNQSLAHCYASRGPDDEIGVDICKASGDIHARLVRDPTRPRYVMIKRGTGPMSAAELVFDGLFEEHAVLVSDALQNEPLADVEPCNMSFDPQGKYYRLRVSSNVDVGLIICCLLSIDELVRIGA